MDSVKSEPREGTTVRKLDDFPELLKALRDGDLVTARWFCAQLFGSTGCSGIAELAEPFRFINEIRRNRIGT